MTASHSTTRSANIRQSSRPWVLRLLDRVFAANALYKQHQALLHLDDALLRDIGLTRFEATGEANRPVWDAPNHWKC